MHIVREIAPGWHFHARLKTVKNDPTYDTVNMVLDVRTIKILNSIADCIDQDIQFDFDVPSLNAIDRVPVSDLELFIDNDNLVQIG